MDSGSDSDGAPEELTSLQGVKQHEEISKVEKESVIRVAQEGKERRRRWAQRRTLAKSDNLESADNLESVESQETKQNEEEEEVHVVPGMLPKDVVEMLAAREKQTFSSDSEEEIINQKVGKRKKRPKTSGPETILLKDVRPMHHVKNSMEFLERRKMQVPRSSAVLRNANQALRLLSSKGNLLSKS